MSVSSEDLKKLEDLLDTLKQDYGKRCLSKFGTEYFSVPFSRRKDVMRHVINTVKLEGKDKEFFRSESVKRLILDTFFPEHAIEKMVASKRKNARNVTLAELRDAVIEAWKSDYTPAGEAIAGPSAYEEFDPARDGRLGKEIDRNVFKDLPKPQDTIDKEASDLLGFKDE